MHSVSGMKAAIKRFPRTVRHRGFLGGSWQWAGLTYLRATREIEGENIYSRDWDVLVILDACRTDLLREVAPEYDFIDKVNTFPSMGSCTAEWMDANFPNAPAGEIPGTIYVAGNPFARLKLTDLDFLELDHVWRYGWDDKFGGVQPRPVTDRAIESGRTYDPDRLIVHYLQPHLPFLSDSSEGLEVENFGGNHYEATPGDWVLIQRGERERESVWRDYRNTLRWVLDDVTLLIENIDAESFIMSSDHGNAAGEYGVYGHPCRTPLSCLTDVPWLEISTTDEETHQPAEYNTSEQKFQLEDRLEDLGYLT